MGLPLSNRRSPRWFQSGASGWSRTRCESGVSLYFNGRALISCDEQGEGMPLQNFNLEAPAFALLIGQTACWSCAATTRAAAIWVPSHVYWHEPDWDPDHEPDPALLGFVEVVSDAALAQVNRYAPWMTFVSTKTSGMTYLGNRCESCGAVQGDHYLSRPGEVFFPETPAQVQALHLIPCEGDLAARASPAVGSWMAEVTLGPDGREP